MFLNLKKINDIYLLSAWHDDNVIEKINIPSDNEYLIDLSKNLYTIKDTKKPNGERFNWRERGESVSIKTIIVHHTAISSALETLNKFIEFGASSHYLVLKKSDINQLKQLSSKKITCIEIIPEEFTAHHAGLSEVSYINNPGTRRGVNDCSIGIETVNTGIEPFEEIQYITIANILQRALPLYGIPIVHCTGHCNITPRRKIDPSGYFEWDKLLTLLYSTIDENYKYKATIKCFETIYKITKGDILPIEAKFNEVCMKHQNIINIVNDDKQNISDQSLFDNVVVDNDIAQFIEDKFTQFSAIGYSKRYTQFNIRYNNLDIAETDKSLYIKNIGILSNMLNAANRMLCYNTNDYKNDDASYFIKLTRARIECLHAIFKLT